MLIIGVAYSDSPSMWQPLEQKNANSNPEGGYFYQLDQYQLAQLLYQTRLENTADQTMTEIQLPAGNGELERFSIVESPIMQPGLASRYPEIKTYKIHGLDNPHASGRLSLTSSGLHGMITTPEGDFYINPQSQGVYRAFPKGNRVASQTINCDIAEHNHQSPVGRSDNWTLTLRKANKIKIYRIAVAATEEFVAAAGGSKADAMDSVTNVINRVNQIYERDLGIRLQLVDNTDNLFFVSGDNYSNGNSLVMTEENQTEITSAIGAANYDIGHVFGTSGGGYGYYGVVCNDNWKAKGVSNGFNAISDESAIDLVAHEIGHQFDARHTFNGTTGSCGGGRVAGSAFEPGSGSTIMAYSGYCGTENVQLETDAMFHAKSIEAIDDFTSRGYGAICAGSLNTDNPGAPSINPGRNFVIPVSTAFVLSAEGNDDDGDALSYAWDQVNIGHATNIDSFGTDITNNPLMRSYLPRSTRSRYFPRLEAVLSDSNNKAETLPTRDRSLKFRASVRDGRGGMDSDDVTIIANSAAGPFRVTSHGNPASLSGGDTQTVNWSVANTDKPPVNCTNVDIDLLMLDARKENYCVAQLAGDVPNTGSATVALPNLSAANARLRVSCSNNIFYALSGTDLEITGSTASNNNCYSVEAESEIREMFRGNDGDSTADLSASGNNGSSRGGGALDVFWIIGLILFRRTGYRSRRRQNR